MAVPAWTKAVGNLLKSEDIYYTYSAIDYNGYHLFDRSRYSSWATAWCNNPPVVKSHVIDIGGMPWRMPTAYSRSIQRYDITPYDVVEDYPWAGFYTLSKGYPGDHSKTDALVRYPLTDRYHFAYQDNARNRSEVQCLLKMQNQKVDFLTYLAEARSAAQQLVDTSIIFFDALLDLKHGRRPKGRFIDVLKGLRDGYLGYEYGFKPFMSDLKGLYDLFQSSIKRPLIIRGVSEVKQEWSSKDHPTKYYVDSQFDASISNKTILYGRVSDADVARMSSVNLVNPLQLAWEIVPYSFLVDWAMPIGNTLQAISAPAGMTFISGSHTQRAEALSAGTEPIAPNNMGPRIESAILEMTRSVYTGWPAPKLYVKNPLSVKHATNALALWSQLLL